MKITLIRKPIKRMYLRVREGEIVVTAPLRTSQAAVEHFVHSHTKWIEKQMERDDGLHDGDVIRILQTPVQIHFTNEREQITDHDLFCQADMRSFQRTVLKAVAPVFEEHFNKQCARLHESGLNLKTAFYKSRWGSCTPAKKQIALNANLAFTDEECIDAILVHELCHLKVMDHSQAFYQEVLRYMPEYKQVHRRLLSYRIPSHIAV